MSKHAQILVFKRGTKCTSYQDLLTQTIYTLPDGDYYILIQDASKKTVPQLGYFHGVLCKILSEETGFTLNECKDYLKLKFGAKKDIIDIKTGEVHTQDKSIAGYSKSEMSEFIDACVQFLTHDLGLIVPEPI